MHFGNYTNFIVHLKYNLMFHIISLEINHQVSDLYCSRGALV
jgi:hypothetical protein